MTVQELLKSTPFETLASSLMALDPGEGTRRSMLGYKQAYDTLCHMQGTPSSEDKPYEVDFEWQRDENDRPDFWTGGGTPLLAGGVEGALWTELVNKVVVTDETFPFTQADLAAAVLWGATFYGFSPKERNKSLDEICDRTYTRYGLERKRLEIKTDLFYVRSKALKEKLERMMEAPNTDDSYALSSEEWAEIDRHKYHCNRIRRKRLYRMEQRAEHLEHLEKRQHLIEHLKVCQPSFPEQLQQQIMLAMRVSDQSIESHVYGEGERMAYLEDLCSHYYCERECSTKENIQVIVMACTSPEHPLTPDEIERAKSLSSQCFTHGGKYQCSIVQGFDDSLAGEVRLHVITISKEKYRKAGVHRHATHINP